MPANDEKSAHTNSHCFTSINTSNLTISRQKSHIVIKTLCNMCVFENNNNNLRLRFNFAYNKNFKLVIRHLHAVDYSPVC